MVTNMISWVGQFGDFSSFWRTSHFTEQINDQEVEEVRGSWLVQ
jgi:hypothetical protein